LQDWQGPTDWVLRGSFPLEVGIALGFQAALDDPFPRSHDNISRFEIDYGDGRGWRDVTADSGRWGYGFAAREHLTTFIYTEPGTYLLHGRAIFYDGEIVESEDVVRVEVLGP
jgi:hypothetical protein